MQCNAIEPCLIHTISSFPLQTVSGVHCNGKVSCLVLVKSTMWRSVVSCYCCCCCCCCWLWCCCCWWCCFRDIYLSGPISLTKTAIPPTENRLTLSQSVAQAPTTHIGPRAEPIITTLPVTVPSQSTPTISKAENGTQNSRKNEFGGEDRIKGPDASVMPTVEVNYIIRHTFGRVIR